MWQNYDLKDHATHERDFGITYSSKIASLFGGTLSGRLSYQNWQYPSGLLGKRDNVVETGLHYSNIIEIDITLTHLFAHDKTKSGNMVYGILSKQFNVFKSEKYFNFSITPIISASYLNHYFQEESRLAHITPAIAVELSKGNFSINLFTKKQYEMDNEKVDKKYSGIIIKYNF